jgi:hypothetical protein
MDLTPPPLIKRRCHQVVQMSGWKTTSLHPLTGQIACAMSAQDRQDLCSMFLPYHLYSRFTIIVLYHRFSPSHIDIAAYQPDYLGMCRDGIMRAVGNPLSSCRHVGETPLFDDLLEAATIRSSQANMQAHPPMLAPVSCPEAMPDNSAIKSILLQAISHRMQGRQLTRCIVPPSLTPRSRTGLIHQPL